MSEETKPDGMELAGYVAYASMQGMKYAIPTIILLAISANFINKLVSAMIRLGGD